MTPDRDPFQWPKKSGCLTASMLEAYAEWLFRFIRLRWEAPGVERREEQADDKEQRKAFEFRKSKGWLSLQRDLRPFVAYVLAAKDLQPWAARHQYMPPRKRGMAMVKDLRAFDEHVLLLLKKKQQQQGQEKGH